MRAAKALERRSADSLKPSLLNAALGNKNHVQWLNRFFVCLFSFYRIAYLLNSKYLHVLYSSKYIQHVGVSLKLIL